MLSLCASLCHGGVAKAQTAEPGPWVTDPYGSVQVTERTPTTIYLAGSFTSLGPASGQGVPTEISTGVPFARYPSVAGVVEAVVADGSRGWFIGGTFDRVGGQRRNNLAYVFADGHVSTWAPDPDGSVWALALDRGRLFVGGAFAAIGGEPRSQAAALDVERHQVLAWNPNVEGGGVRAVAIDGNRVYLGGFFARVGGQLRAGLASVDGESGNPTPWNPAANASDVFAIAVAGGEIYVGGRFSATTGSFWRSDLAAFDRTTNELLPCRWSIERIPECYHCDDGPFVRAMVAERGKLYFGGSFTHVNSVARSGLAAIDLTSRELTGWDPHATGDSPIYPYVYALAARAGAVYVGGNFTGLGGDAHAYVGAVDTEAGLATGWFPRTNGEVHAIAATDRAIYIGGEFTSVWYWQARNRLAALDAQTGALTPWRPAADAEVTAMKASGNTIYVAGAFASIEGQPRQGIAALDAATGQLAPWNPGVDAALSRAVRAMVMLHGTLYVGGSFYGIAGEPRRNLAAIDSASARATSWNPSVRSDVAGMIARGDMLLVGGIFTNIGGQPRAGLAAIDTGGTVLAWSPQVDCSVTSLLLAEDKVIAAGSFAETLGVWRLRIAEFDVQSGSVTRWIASTDNIVVSMASADHVLYAGGHFDTIEGQPRHGLASFDLETGSVLEWDPQQNGAIVTLQATDYAVDVGGVFTHIAHDARSGFAVLSPAVRLGGRPIVSGPGLALAQNAPNPSRGSTLVRFELKRPGPVTLSVYDLAGRCIARPLANEPREAGPQEIVLQTHGWPSGVYYYRASAPGATSTRKMVVLN
jgi:trimeric autotransporter adhesin